MIFFSAAVAGMVAVGGITRLTRSGLSMTSWKLEGSRPPVSQAEWEAEFARYKTFPEWRQRQSMTLEEFKFIYYWEWGHRMLGRSLGILFIGERCRMAMKLLMHCRTLRLFLPSRYDPATSLPSSRTPIWFGWNAGTNWMVDGEVWA